MKTLLIYMSEGMASHDLSLHHHRTIREDESVDECFIQKMGTYRDHWRGKHTAKLVMTILNVNDETGTTTIIHEEQHTHPLKPKIVINKPVGGVKRTYRPASSFLSGPSPSAIAAFAAQQTALNAAQLQEDFSTQMDSVGWDLGSVTTTAGNV